MLGLARVPTATRFRLRFCFDQESLRNSQATLRKSDRLLTSRSLLVTCQLFAPLRTKFAVSSPQSLAIIWKLVDDCCVVLGFAQYLRLQQ